MKAPQITLRDLFWLVLVAAILCGWLVERERLRQHISDLKSSREKSVRSALIQKLKARLASGDAKEIRVYGGGNLIEIVPLSP